MNAETEIASQLIGSVWVRIAGIYGALAVALGAYGAHVVSERKDTSEHIKVVYDRANKYHLFHSLALLAVPLTSHPNLVGTLLIIGMTIFCGTCYIYALTGKRSVTRFAPFGGTTLIIAWFAMAFS